MTEKVKRALHFAKEAHEGQKRKYTGEDYIVHPIEVASLIAHLRDEDMDCAALLHDVVEDTPITLYKINSEFGTRVAKLVEELTDVTTKADGNRKTRKLIELHRISKISPQAKTIKIADLISNSKSIIEHDPNFAKIYIQEKKDLLMVLREGDQHLWDRANKLIAEYFKGLKNDKA